MEFETKILLHSVSRALYIPEHKIFSNGKKSEIAEARQVVQYFLKEHTDFSLEKIGEETGGKDHATILHSYKTIKNFIEIGDARIISACNSVKESIKQLLVNGKIKKLYEVEEGIPIPIFVPGNKKYPFDTLKPGSSFCAWPSYEYKVMRKIQHASYKYASKNKIKLMVRKWYNKETMRDEIRVWRIK